MIAKLPWFPFYHQEFFADEKVQLMSWEQVGMYVKLLSHQWAEGSIPAQLEAQLSLLKIPVSSSLVPACEAVAGLCFKPLLTDSTRLANAKLERVRTQQSKKDQIYQERARKGGLARQAQRKLTISSPEVQLKSAIQNQNQIQKENKESLPNGSSFESTVQEVRKPRPRSAIDLLDCGQTT